MGEHEQCIKRSMSVAHSLDGCLRQTLCLRDAREMGEHREGEKGKLMSGLVKEVLICRF